MPQIPGPPDAVVRALAARLPLVLSAEVKTEQIPGEAGTGASTAGLLLEYRLSVPTLAGPSITKALWEGNLLAGAVADEYAARGFGQIVGASATLVATDGREQPVGGGIGHVVPDQVFDDVPSSIAATVARGGATAGLRNVAVSKVRGLQEALVVSATTDNPAQTAAALAQPGAGGVGGGGMGSGRGPAPRTVGWEEYLEGAQQRRCEYVLDSAWARSRAERSFHGTIRRSQVGRSLIAADA